MPGPVQFTQAKIMAVLGGEPADDNEPAHIAPIAHARKHAKALTPKNVVQLAKARLKDARKELRRMKALEKECAQLERLIRAAEDKTPRLAAIKRSVG